jgi:hypothetical protein
MFLTLLRPLLPSVGVYTFTIVSPCVYDRLAASLYAQDVRMRCVVRYVMFLTVLRPPSACRKYVCFLCNIVLCPDPLATHSCFKLVGTLSLLYFLLSDNVPLISESVYTSLEHYLYF